jgi:hypothetical protein
MQARLALDNHARAREVMLIDPAVSITSRVPVRATGTSTRRARELGQ